MNAAAATEPGLIPLSRELIKDARMMIIGYRPADPDVVRQILPEKLTPHPDGIVLLNLWTVEDPGLSSGLGTYGRLSCGYLAPEVQGYDTQTSDGSATGHGRYFAHHWLESDGMRAFARASCGNVADVGRVEQHEPEPGVLVAELFVDDEVVIRTTSRVGNEKLASVGGHLNYFTTLGESPGDGDLARVSVPYVADVMEAHVESIEWLFDEDHPAAALAPRVEGAVDSVLYGNISWVPFSVAELL
jgi:hypothetical protein